MRGAHKTEAESVVNLADTARERLALDFGPWELRSAYEAYWAKALESLLRGGGFLWSDPLRPTLGAACDTHQRMKCIRASRPPAVRH